MKRAPERPFAFLLNLFTWERTGQAEAVSTFSSLERWGKIGSWASGSMPTSLSHPLGAPWREGFRTPQSYYKEVYCIVVPLFRNDQKPLYERSVTMRNFIFSNYYLMFWRSYFYLSGNTERGFVKSPGSIPNLSTGCF